MIDQPIGPFAYRYVEHQLTTISGPPHDISAIGLDIDAGPDATIAGARQSMVPEQQMQTAIAALVCARVRDAIAMRHPPHNRCRFLGAIEIEHVNVGYFSGRHPDKRARMS